MQLKSPVENDLERDDSRAQRDTLKCWVCGHGFVYDQSLFCSERCRDAYDCGFPKHDPHHVRALTAVPLGAWKIVAGPPGSKIGSRYYADIVDRPLRPKLRRKRSVGTCA
jgi:hypothetical protein